jgi:hypothetical protein
MDYGKLSTDTLKQLKSGQPIDYSTLPTEDLLALKELSKPKPSMLESGLRGAAQGASLGFADEITGGVESLLTGKPYDQARDESRAAYDAAQKANPGTYLAGDVGGAVASSMIPGLNVAKAATIGGRIGTAALGGALSGLGNSKADNALDMAKDTGTGAALAGGIQGAGEALVPVAKYGAGKLSQMLSQASENGSPTANRLLSRVAKFTSGVDDDAALRQIQRPLQTAAAEGDDFAFNVGKKALQETEDLGSTLGKNVGKAKDEFLQQSGATVFPEAQSLKMRVEDFLRANKPSERGFSAISDKERDALLQLNGMLDGPINGEDLVKARDYFDHVKRLAGQYDKEGTGPVINFMKGIRGQADGILDRASPEVDAANKAFSQFSDDTSLLRGSTNAANSESMINNLYGANKGMQQEAAGRLFTPATMESAQDIAANKAFMNATRPGGDNYFRRGALAAVTMGGSEIATNPRLWKSGLRYVGRVEQTLKSNPQVLGQYAETLTNAMNRGPQALAATHFILSQRDPNYREITNGLSEDAK